VTSQLRIPSLTPSHETWRVFSLLTAQGDFTIELARVGSQQTDSHRLSAGRYTEPAEEIGTVLIAAQTRTGR
jgi:hypothetical protein